MFESFLVFFFFNWSSIKASWSSNVIQNPISLMFFVQDFLERKRVGKFSSYYMVVHFPIYFHWYLFHVFWSYVIWNIYIHDCCIFLMNWLFYYLQMSHFTFGNTFFLVIIVMPVFLCFAVLFIFFMLLLSTYLYVGLQPFGLQRSL